MLIPDVVGTLFRPHVSQFQCGEQVPDLLLSFVVRNSCSCAKQVGNGLFVGIQLFDLSLSTLGTCSKRT